MRKEAIEIVLNGLDDLYDDSLSASLDYTSTSYIPEAEWHAEAEEISKNVDVLLSALAGTVRKLR